MKRIVSFLAFIAALAAAFPAYAAFPDRPVKVVVSYPPGAATDAAARVLTRKLSEYWGQPVIVENRPGNAGILHVASSTADGYTLYVGADSNMVTAPAAIAKIGYSTDEFAPVGLIVTNSTLIAATPNIDVKSIDQLVGLARKEPGQLNFSSSGYGSTNHLSMELLMSMTKISMTHIPYKGAQPAVTELMAGHVQFGVYALSSVLPLVTSGKIVAVAIGSGKRSDLLPNVPTVAESGVPGFDVTMWYGLFAPAKTPDAVIRKINTDMQRALREPEVSRQLVSLGADPAPTSTDEFAHRIAGDRAKWDTIVKQRNLMVDQ